jgi:uncharacterized protein
MAIDYNSHLQYLTTSRRKSIKGVSFPLDTKGTGGVFTYNEGIKSIRDGIIQLLLTNKGERIMRPGFGVNLRRSVFDQNDPLLAEGLKKQVTEAITTYEPRVVIKKLTVTPKEHTLTILLKMALKDDLLRDEIVEITI